MQIKGKMREAYFGPVTYTPGESSNAHTFALAFP